MSSPCHLIRYYLNNVTHFNQNACHGFGLYGHDDIKPGKSLRMACVHCRSKPGESVYNRGFGTLLNCIARDVHLGRSSKHSLFSLPSHSQVHSHMLSLVPLYTQTKVDDLFKISYFVTFRPFSTFYEQNP